MALPQSRDSGPLEPGNDEIERCEHGVAWDDDCDRCCDFCGESITGIPGSHSCYAGTFWRDQ